MHIDIKTILDSKNMRRYELAQKIDVTYPTITAMYNGTSTSIKFDILEKICNVLKCTPNDILILDNNDNVFNNQTNDNFEHSDFDLYMNKPQNSSTE